MASLVAATAGRDDEQLATMTSLVTATGRRVPRRRESVVHAVAGADAFTFFLVGDDEGLGAYALETETCLWRDDALGNPPASNIS